MRHPPLAHARRRPQGRPRARLDRVTTMDTDDKDIHLNVLPNSGKIEQMRQSGTGAPPVSSSKNFADRNVIDRAVDATKTPRQKAIEERVIEALRSIYDPEIPVNIYDLGLIYDINVDDQTGA